MKVEINVTWKKVVLIILTAFILYIVIIKLLTFNELSKMDLNCEFIIQAIDNNDDKLFQDNKYFLGENGYSLFKIVSLDIFKSEGHVYLWNKIKSWLDTSKDLNLNNIDKNSLKKIIIGYSSDIKAKQNSYFMDNISTIIAFLLSLIGSFMTIFFRKPNKTE